MTRGAARVAEPGEAEWVTQDQAARLTGAPLSSIDWWARSGKIETRPAAQGPTVNRRSVIEHAASREQHRAELAAKKAARSIKESQQTQARRPPRPRNSVTTAEAAAILGRSRAYVATLARREGLTLTPWRGRVLLDRDEVEAYAEAMARWISFADAAGATRLPVTAIRRAVEAGGIATNPDARPLTPRLERDSVMTWAAGEKQRRQEAAGRRAQARRVSGPPNDGRAWMSVRSAAVLLGISEYRTIRQIEREELPATHHNGKWWLQPVHVLSVLAGREYRAHAG